MRLPLQFRINQNKVFLRYNLVYCLKDEDKKRRIDTRYYFNI